MTCVFHWASAAQAAERTKPRSKPRPDFGYDDSIDVPPASHRPPLPAPDSFDSGWRFGFGAGINLPDLFPFELWGRMNSWLGGRVFFAPAFAFDVRIELPRDQISSKNGILIENPAMNIHLDGVYGPHYGGEIWAYPWAGTFYVGAGLSYRKLTLEGVAKAPLLITFADLSFETNTKFGVDAFAETEGILARFDCGWMFEMRGWYVHLGPFGIAIPKRLERTVRATGIVDSPGAEDEELVGALAQFRNEKESELHDKALKEIRPAESMALPIASVSIGIVF